MKSQVENDKRDNFQQVQAKNQHVPRCLEYGWTKIHVELVKLFEYCRKAPLKLRLTITWQKPNPIQHQQSNKMDIKFMLDFSFSKITAKCHANLLECLVVL